MWRKGRDGGSCGTATVWQTTSGSGRGGTVAEALVRSVGAVVGLAVTLVDLVAKELTGKRVPAIIHSAYQRILLLFRSFNRDETSVEF